jgi:chromate transporter
VAVGAVSNLLALAALFGELSMLAVGGGNSVIPEMQRQVVAVHHWMGAREFAALYALAQAAPGPNMMVVSLVGWRVAGVWGALVATCAVTVPSSVLTFLVSGWWERFREAGWRKAVQAGLQPVTAGLVLASAALLVRSTAVDVPAALVVVVAVLVFVFTEINPLIVLGGAALLGVAGVVG